MTARGEGKFAWSLGIRLLHWLTAALVGVQIAFAFALMGGSGMAKVLWLPFHVSVGVSIFSIIFVRLVWRVFERAPARPASPLVRRLAAFVHASLYLLILAVVLTGWLAYSPAPLMPPARLFSYMPLPTAPRFQAISPREFAMIHLTLVWV
jgi:cytochrome b561